MIRAHFTLPCIYLTQKNKVDRPNIPFLQIFAPKEAKIPRRVSTLLSANQDIKTHFTRMFVFTSQKKYIIESKQKVKIFISFPSMTRFVAFQRIPVAQ